MGRSQRIKGRAFEQLVARLFRRVWPEAKRGIGQARMGGEVPDVDPHPDWWIECKHQRSCSWRAAYKQALEANDGRRQRVLAVTRDTGGDVFAHLKLNDLLDLLEELAWERKRAGEEAERAGALGG
jgi:hypothetical protein